MTANNPDTPKLQRVVRFDNLPLTQTYFTEEGYLMDHPIVTTCGIFEYTNPDGSIRKELRLPDEVFAEKSLSSYKGKPIIITHDAGAIDKDNVGVENIGTILSKGYKDGDSVRAEIVIHETDKMKECGLRELSLGYNLTLDETPGEWNGEHYDAIQRNIEINHLALVGSARAGETARLNIDGKNKSQGGNAMSMKKRLDSESMDPTAFAEAIEAYKARKAARNGANNADPAAEPVVTEPVKTIGDEEENSTPVDKVQMVKDRRDRRDAEEEPKDVDSAMGVIAQQDEDIDALLEVIEGMKAKEDFDSADDNNPKTNDDEDDEKNEDCSDDKSGSLNMDSVDLIVSKKLEVCRIGDTLHMDGIENMSILEAKKAIIKKVKPTIRLDGKSKTYIDAMFDITKESIAGRKDTDYQRGQMFNADSRSAAFKASGESEAAKARKRMIEKQNGGNQ